ncbi:MAG: ABC transporter ATP-binding protein [Gammaproteobacteria bacterium]|jgi:peptide/nickel transport system ATP-binding protein|nr:ABC transporter ATP-binding protein [Gammaproteobacteria bacterium]
MNNTPLLKINNLTVTYPLGSEESGVFKALDNASLKVNSGQIIGIVGESGAGKSTIGKAILGLLDPPAKLVSGEIRFLGNSLIGLSEAQFESLRGNQIGYIYQNPMTALNPVLTIGEQVIEAIEANTDMRGKNAREYAIQLLERADVSFAEDRLQKYPHQLSGGLCQRIVFAIAIAAKPKLIIADEPTTALDVTVQQSVLQTLIKLSRQEQIAIILITHDIGVIAETCDYVYVLRYGKHVEQDATNKVLQRPTQDYTRSLMASVPLIEKRLHRFALNEEDNLEDISTGLHYLQEKKTTQDSINGPILEVRNLSKVFITPSSMLKAKQLFTAVKDVNFTVQRGETVGIVGESGSGKSTIGRMILGLEDITEGSVIYRGKNLKLITDANERRAHCLSMQCIFQDPYSSLNPRMTAGENITYGLRVHKMISSDDAKSLAQELMALVGLPREDAEKLPHAFSGGERQRIGIARALSYRPDFIFCDEPTSALDVSVQANLLNLLKDLQEKFSLTLLFVSHDLAVIRQMCDRVIVMKEGKALESDSNDNIFEHPKHQYTRSLLDAMPKFKGLART